MPNSPRAVIVGAGQAAAAAAAHLQKHGFDGTVTVIGNEAVPPYERPPLSKAYLRGELDATGLLAQPAGLWTSGGVELRLDTTATRIDRLGRRLHLSDGSDLGFDWLVLATGSAPRRFAVPGADLDGVLTLYTAADADELRARARVAEHVLVVGGGWLGSEVSASLRSIGVPVTLAVTSAMPLESALGPQVASVYDALHREHGVQVLPNTSVVELAGEGGVRRALTSAGEWVAADVVVAAVGADPRLGLAATTGLVVDGAVPVDGTLRTSDPRILAVGDIARVPYPDLGRSLRVAHWGAAQFQGSHAAETILGRATEYRRFPYFFSDQYDTGMEFWGDPLLPGELIVRGSLADRSFTAFWHAEGRVRAVLNMHVHSHQHSHEPEPEPEHSHEHSHEPEHSHEHEHEPEPAAAGSGGREAVPAAHTHSGNAHLDSELVDLLLRARHIGAAALRDDTVPLDNLVEGDARPQ